MGHSNKGYYGVHGVYRMKMRASSCNISHKT